MRIRNKVIVSAVLVTAAVWALAAPLAAQSMPTYWRLADPDAKLLLGFDLKAIMNSQAVEAAKAQMLQAATGAGALNTFKLMDEGGALTDLLHRVDRVFVSFGEIPQSSTAKPKMTVALVGDFDLAVLRKLMAGQGGTKAVYRGVEVWQSGTAEDNVMIALASNRVIAVGDKVSVRKAVNQFAAGNGSVMSSPLFQRAAAMAQTTDFWVAGEIPPTLASSLAKSGSGGLAGQMFQSLKSFDVGIRAKTGFDLELNLFTDSPEAATNLSNGLQGIIQLAAASQTDKQVNDLISRLRMGTDGAQIQISAAWNAQELAAAMQMRGKSAAPAGSLSAPRLAKSTPIQQPVVPVIAAPAKPKEPLKVRIYNPDGGIKEFELKRDF